MLHIVVECGMIVQYQYVNTSTYRLLISVQCTSTAITGGMGNLNICMYTLTKFVHLIKERSLNPIYEK